MKIPLMRAKSYKQMLMNCFRVSGQTAKEFISKSEITWVGEDTIVFRNSNLSIIIYVVDVKKNDGAWLIEGFEIIAETK